MNLLEARQIRFGYPRRREGALFELGPIDLSLARGELVGVAGRNGVGKTTLLLILAGLLRPTGGQVLRASEYLRLGVCFQNARRSLLPWKTVARNIDFAATSSIGGLSRLLKAGRVDDAKYPYELSGGQQQLVNIARAFQMGADCVLLDEPFSSLDYDNSLAFAEWLLDATQRTDCSTLLIAHSLEMQLALADRLVILGGQPCQIQADWRASDVRDWPDESSFQDRLNRAGVEAQALRVRYDEFI